jgi:hypothetical protein
VIAILDGLQQAYKVTANSLYGQTGAPTSPIYMKQIAASTTATGREMLQFSKIFIETAKHRQKENRILNANFYCEDIPKFCRKRGKYYDKTFGVDNILRTLREQTFSNANGIKSYLKQKAQQ